MNARLPGSVFVAYCLMAAGAARAQTITTAYSFSQAQSGTVQPQGDLLYRNGKFYDGSADGVFQLTPPTAQNPAWSEQLIYSYVTLPASGVAMDPAGDLYGAVDEGGANGSGDIFSLTPPAVPGGAWTPTILYSFPAEGYTFTASSGTLYRDAAGVLYGTTSAWTGASGIVYSLTPPSAGQNAWTFSLLHAFTGGSDGGAPQAGVIGAPGGALVGTAFRGGIGNNGTVFQLTPPATPGGNWTESSLYHFKGGTADGSSPASTLAIDAAGNLYGTTYTGGAYRHGTAFELTPPAQGSARWTETLLQSLTGNPNNGLTVTSDGTLYGVTQGEGFRLTPSVTSPGQWLYAALPTPGSVPGSALLNVANTYLFGTDLVGGSFGSGDVYYIEK